MLDKKYPLASSNEFPLLETIYIPVHFSIFIEICVQMLDDLRKYFGRPDLETIMLGNGGWGGFGNESFQVSDGRVKELCN
jgi:hypothetical protein